MFTLEKDDLIRFTRLPSGEWRAADVLEESELMPVWAAALVLCSVVSNSS